MYRRSGTDPSLESCLCSMSWLLVASCRQYLLRCLVSFCCGVVSRPVHGSAQDWLLVANFSRCLVSFCLFCCGVVSPPRTLCRYRPRVASGRQFPRCLVSFCRSAAVCVIAHLARSGLVEILLTAFLAAFPVHSVRWWEAKNCAVCLRLSDRPDQIGFWSPLLADSSASAVFAAVLCHRPCLDRDLVSCEHFFSPSRVSLASVAVVVGDGHALTPIADSPASDRVYFATSMPRTPGARLLLSHPWECWFVSTCHLARHGPFQRYNRAAPRPGQLDVASDSYISAYRTAARPSPRGTPTRIAPHAILRLVHLRAEIRLVPARRTPARTAPHSGRTTSRAALRLVQLRFTPSRFPRLPSRCFSIGVLSVFARARASPVRSSIHSGRLRVFCSSRESSQPLNYSVRCSAYVCASM